MTGVTAWGVVARDNGAAINKVTRAHKEAGCSTATNATEWGSVGEMAAYNAAVAGRDAAAKDEVL